MAGQEVPEAGHGQRPGGADSECRPVEQGDPHLEGGAVERHRGEVRHDSAGTYIGVLGRTHEAVDSPVGDRDSLGGAGGARGVDDIGGLVRTRRCGTVQPGERAVVLAGHRRPHGRIIQRDPVRARLRVEGARAGLVESAGEGRGGDQGDRRRVGHHETDATGGVRRVDRQIGAPGLQHRQQHGDPLGRTVHHHRDHGLGTHPVVDQVPGEAVGFRVELRVRHPLVAADQRDGLGGTRGPRAEQLGHGGGGLRACCVVPLGQDSPPLVVVEQVDSVQGPVGVGRGRAQDVDQPGGERLGRGPVEEIAGVGDPAVHTGRPALVVEALFDLEVEVELGHGDFGGPHLDGRSWQAITAWGPFCTASMTWNSGCLASERTGASSSTTAEPPPGHHVHAGEHLCRSPSEQRRVAPRRSPGTGRCAPASVFTKNSSGPDHDLISAALRSGLRRRRPPPRPASTAAPPGPCHTMNTVKPCAAPRTPPPGLSREGQQRSPASSTTSRWVVAMPLGSPVDPEVNIT
ncbi:hypothetical protein SANTM175S_08181 [Streptomyces antimycoticus]